MSSEGNSNVNIFSDYIEGESVLIGEEIKTDKVQTELFSDEDIKPDKKNNDQKKETEKKETEKKKPFDPEYEKLKNRSANSVLMKHLQVEELNQLKIENEKLTFLKNAGKVADVKFMDFLYFGYMEKANLDLMKMVKKIRVLYEPLVPVKVLKECIDILSDEISYVLKSIKKKQAEEVKNWKDG